MKVKQLQKYLIWLPVTKFFTSFKETSELFCIIDEFCKHFNAENLLEDNSGVKRRRRQASLSDSEIMTILLYFHFGTFRNFKHYYLFFTKGTMKSYFPKTLPSTPYLMSFSSKRKLYNRIGQNEYQWYYDTITLILHDKSVDITT